MPTYIVRAPETTLSPTVKASLAERITRVHAEVTAGADAFVQVLFYGAQPDDCYLGGAVLRGPHCFIQGHIRAGRSALERADLIRALIPEVGDLLGVPRYAIWIYLSELPARAMAEFGHILPEQGDENAWLAALLPEERRRLASLTLDEQAKTS